MFIFVKERLRQSVSNMQVKVENTGFLHVLPNKGGLVCSFEINGTRLAFISCHLTAHEGVKHCEARNSSIIEILVISYLKTYPFNYSYSQ